MFDNVISLFYLRADLVAVAIGLNALCVVVIRARRMKSGQINEIHVSPMTA